MEFLREIIQQIADRRLKKIEIFNEDKRGKTSNYYKLYRGIRKGQINSDEEASRMILDTNASDKKYLMLKSRLRNRLLNTLFFLDVKSSFYSEVFVNYYKCNRDFLGARILLTVGARKSAVQLLRRTFRKAAENEFSELAFLCARYLRNHFAMLGNHTKFARYNELLEEHKAVLDAEVKVEGIYQSITIAYERTASVKERNIDLIKKQVGEIALIADQHNNFNIKLYYYRLLIILDQLENNYNQMIQHCHEMEQHFNDNVRLIQNARLIELTLLKMVAYMHIGDHANGKSVAEKKMHLFKENSNNWMIFHEYYFLLCMNTGNYIDAHEVYSQVSANNKFETLSEVRKEKWRIYKAYLLYSLKDIQEDLNAEQRAHLKTMEDRFRLFKFLNELSIYSKDKKGFNIAIVIIQVLFLIKMDRRSEVIDKMDSIRVYSSRYLRDKALERTLAFIKLLQNLVKSDFKHNEQAPQVQKQMQKLQSSSWAYSQNNDDIEIIPYEKLWSMLINNLQSSASKAR